MFTKKKETCLPVTLSKKQISQGSSAKCRGIHLHRRLPCKRIYEIREKTYLETQHTLLTNRKTFTVIICNFVLKRFGQTVHSFGAYRQIQAWKRNNLLNREAGRLWHSVKLVTASETCFALHSAYFRKKKGSLQASFCYVSYMKIRIFTKLGKVNNKRSSLFVV